MSDDASTPEALLNLEKSLRLLSPRSASIDRDALMFAAGRQSANRARGVWPVVSLLTALAGAAIGFGSARYSSNERTPIADVESTPAEPPQTATVCAASYLVLRDRVLRDGVDALATEPSTGTTHEINLEPLRWQPLRDFDRLFELDSPRRDSPS